MIERKEDSEVSANYYQPNTFKLGIPSKLENIIVSPDYWNIGVVIGNFVFKPMDRQLKNDELDKRNS